MEKIIGKNWRTTLYAVLYALLTFLLQVETISTEMFQLANGLLITLGFAAAADGANGSKPSPVAGTIVKMLIVLIVITSLIASCIPSIRTTAGFVKASKTLAMEDIKVKFPSDSFDYPVDSLGRYTDKHGLVTIKMDSISPELRKTTIVYNWDRISYKTDSLIDAWSELLIQKVKERKARKVELSIH
ncbi:MAG: hypothetical protein NW226_17525 [Microscillaceae bacterium]|nr:hypothetical protein [Microscillaceae bacterium]